jgi:hypothetical protein
MDFCFGKKLKFRTNNYKRLRLCLSADVANK